MSGRIDFGGAVAYDVCELGEEHLMRAYGVMASAALAVFWCGDAYAQGGGQPPPPPRPGVMPSQSQPTTPAAAPPPPASAYPAPAPQPSPTQPAPPPPYPPGAEPVPPPAATDPGYSQAPQGAPPPAYPQPGYAPPQTGYAEQPAYSAYEEPSSSEVESEPPWRANQPGFVLGAERLTGFYYWNTDPDPPGSQLSGTTFNLLFTRDSAYSIVTAPTSSPRLSFDGVLGPGVTVGGSLGFSSNTTESDASNQEITFTTFMVNPRVGYIVPTSDAISLWPRVGIVYSIQSLSEGTEDISIRVLALTLDPMLVVHPLAHVGILLGPVFEVSLTGTAESDTNSNDFSTLVVGGAAGVAIFF